METVRVKMNAGDLKGVVDLPNYPDDLPVDITVRPAVEKNTLSKADVEKIINELAGCLSNSPDKDKTLDEIRHERIMRKYESLH